MNEITGLYSKLAEWYGVVVGAYSEMWHAVIPWLGKHVYHLEKPINNFTNGSGDTTFDYVLLLTQFLLAIIACIIWSVLDRNRPSYNTAHYWLRVLLRYYVAGMMLVYGIIKIFHLQMPFPYLSQLVQPFGDKSPMGLAWSFVGYSKGYSAYSGIAEVIAGLLLLFRRTTLIGAISTAIVMLNVAMLNYCYDVPVKLFSSVLLLMAIFLMAPDFKRLGKLFFFNKPVESVDMPPMLTTRKLKITRIILKSLMIIYVLYANISSGIGSQREYGDLRPLPPLYGIYNSELVIRNHDTVPPLTTDTTRWKQLIVQFKENAQVKLMNDSLRRFSFIVDTSTHQIQLFKPDDTLHKSSLSYQVDSSILVIKGKWLEDSIYMKFRKYDINRFRLVSRGFHWINEFPYNR